LIQLLKRRWFAIALMMVLASLLAACAGGPPPVTSWPGMVMQNNTAYIASSDQIYALDVQPNIAPNLRLLRGWPFKLTTVAYGQPALSADGKKLYLGTDTASGNSGTILAFDTEAVTVTWSFPAPGATIKLGSVYGGVILTKNKLFFADGNGLLFALNAADGTLAWPQPFDPGTNTRIWSSPAVNDKLVFVASQDHHVYAVDQATGNLAWKFPADQSIEVGTFSGSPAVYKDTVYVGSFDDNLYAIDLKGNLKWKFKTQGRLWEPPIEIDGTLYFGDLSGYVYAVDAATGEADWPQPGKVEGGVRATPLIANNKIYVGTDQFKLYALDMNGNPFWQSPFTGKDGEMFVVTPAITGTSLIALPNLAGATPTRLYGLNADTGAQLWFYPPPTQ
jgi:outer membrane protein assembly factor BamB